MASFSITKHPRYDISPHFNSSYLLASLFFQKLFIPTLPSHPSKKETPRASSRLIRFLLQNSFLVNGLTDAEVFVF